MTFLSRLDREILTCFDDVVLNCCWCCLFAINCLNAIVGLNSVYPRRSDSSVYKKESARVSFESFEYVISIHLLEETSNLVILAT